MAPSRQLGNAKWADPHIRSWSTPAGACRAKHKQKLTAVPYLKDEVCGDSAHVVGSLHMWQFVAQIYRHSSTWGRQL